MNKKVIGKVKTAESTISLVLGIIVVIAAVVLLFNYFKGYTKRASNETSTETSTENQEEAVETGTTAEGTGTPSYTGALPTTYKVVEGDTLWSISNNFFGYGYNWVDISKENKLANPEQIEVGQELTIPKVEVKIPVSVAGAQSTKANSISEKEYKVVKGDNLWNISVRAYQDGYKWPDIAKANNLSNPNVIEVDQVLAIPR